MKTVLCTLVLCALPTLCEAQSCVQREYAQLKDEAKTALGRTRLRFEYCLNRNTQRFVGVTGRSGQICEDQNAKIEQVLTDAGDSAGLLFAMRDCKGPVPPASN